MKLQLDTTYKTIKLESSVKISELIKTLKRLLPNGEWKTFTLETNTSITYWHDPIIIKEYPTYPRQYPWYQSLGAVGSYDILCENKSKNIGESMSLTNGTFNIEYKA